LCIEFAYEGLIAILHGDGVMAFSVGRDVDVEANDTALIGFSYTTSPDSSVMHT
jgi:hypothetical protein